MLSQVALATDTAQVLKFLNTQGIKNVSVYTFADNVTIAGSLRDIMLATNAFDTLHDGHYEYDEKIILRTLKKPGYMHEADEVDDAMLPTTQQLKVLIAEVYEHVVPQQERQDWSNVIVQTEVVKHLGCPVGNDVGIVTWLGQHAARFERICKFITSIPGCDPADIDALIMSSLDSRCQHVVAGVNPRLIDGYARRIDDAIVEMYCSFYNNASAEDGSMPEDVKMSQEQRQMLFLRADVKNSGKGIKSMRNQQKANVWLVTIKGVLNMCARMRLPAGRTIIAHVRTYMSADIQIELDQVKRACTGLDEESLIRVQAQIPLTVDEFIRVRVSTKHMAFTMRKTHANHRNRCFELSAIRYDGTGIRRRLYEAQSARIASSGAEQPLKNSRSRFQTRLTPQGWILAFSTMMGWPVPGYKLLQHITCDCHGEHRDVDVDHPYACSAAGRSQVHRAVNHALGTAIALLGGNTVTFQRFEPRGKDFYQKGGGRGPDMEVTVHGQKTFIDVSAVADSTKQHRINFHAARVTTNQYKIKLARANAATEIHKPIIQRAEHPLEVRDRTKMESACAIIALENGAKFISGSFTHSGGLSKRFKLFVVRCFQRAHSKHEFEFGHDISTGLEFALQMISAAIVNATADYVIKNMKRMLRNNGLGEIQLRWWHGADQYKDEWQEGTLQIDTTTCGSTIPDAVLPSIMTTSASAAAAFATQSSLVPVGGDRYDTECDHDKAVSTAYGQPGEPDAAQVPGLTFTNTITILQSDSQSDSSRSPSPVMRRPPRCGTCHKGFTDEQDMHSTVHHVRSFHTECIPASDKAKIVFVSSAESPTRREPSLQTATGDATDNEYEENQSDREKADVTSCLVSGAVIESGVAQGIVRDPTSRATAGHRRAGAQDDRVGGREGHSDDARQHATASVRSVKAAASVFASATTPSKRPRMRVDRDAAGRMIAFQLNQNNPTSRGSGGGGQAKQGRPYMATEGHSGTQSGSRGGAGAGGRGERTEGVHGGVRNSESRVEIDSVSDIQPVAGPGQHSACAQDANLGELGGGQNDERMHGATGSRSGTQPGYRGGGGEQRTGDRSEDVDEGASVRVRGSGNGLG